MQNESVIWAAVITSGATVIAALISFVYSIVVAVRRERRAVADRRRVAVERVLDTIDRLIRDQRKPVMTRMWRTSEVDVALAKDRLLLDVPKGEVQLWLWLKARVDEMVAPDRKRELAAIGGEMSGALTEWYRGGLSTEWFKDQNVVEGNKL